MLLGALLVGLLIVVLGPRGATVSFALAGLVLWLLNLPRPRRIEQVLGVPDDLAAQLRVASFAAQAMIVRAGEPGDRLYIVKRDEAAYVYSSLPAFVIAAWHLTAVKYFTFALLHT